MRFMLNKNDTIGVISPSSQIKDVKELDEVKDFIKNMGYNVKIFDGCYFNEQTDKHKVLELEQAFEDPCVKAIICVRGGYGSIRILDEISYQKLIKNPKIFAGSSDITALLLQINRIVGFETFHSPMLSGDGKFNKKTFEDFVKTVNNNKKEIKPKKNAIVLKEGEAKGILWGGNLSTLVSLFGSLSGSYIPSEDIILFLEDLNEPVYKIDRMLTQIYRNERLKRRIKGIILGDFLYVDDKNKLQDVLSDFAKKVDVPCIFGYPITHLKTNTTVPVGKKAHFNTDDMIIYFD